VDVPRDDRADHFSLNKESSAFKTSAKKLRLISGVANL
jgi:hypothetical protein